MPRRFWYVSDLHLDLRPEGEQPVCWAQVLKRSDPRADDNLILAGDVAQLNWRHYGAFLTYCAEHFRQVFVVPGNHEFYEHSWAEGYRILHAWAVPRVHVLVNRRYVLDDQPGQKPLTILGCTLWSHIPPEAQPVCERAISDFHSIRGYSIRQHNFFHSQDRLWLTRQLDELCHVAPVPRLSVIEQSSVAPPLPDTTPLSDTTPLPAPLLVITHHAPLTCGVSHPRFEASPRAPTNHAYCTDLSAIVARLPPGSAWVFGHTHHRARVQYGEVSVVTNALGYDTDQWTQPYQLQAIEVGP